MEAEKFLQQLAKDKTLPPLLLLTGEEDYHIDKVLAAAKLLWCGAAAEDGSVSVLDADPTAGALLEMVTELPFFCPKSLIIIKNSKLLSAGKQGDTPKDKEAYVKALEKTAEHCRVIFQCAKPDKRTKLFKAFSSLGQVVECEKIKPWLVKNWLAQAARERGCRWDAAALELAAGYASLAENISLYLLDQEVEKISLYAGERKLWTVDDVNSMFSSLTELSGFALTDAMTVGDAAKALSIMREAAARGVYVLQLVGLIARQVRQLWQARDILAKGGGQDEIAAKLSIPAFIAGNIARQARRIPEEKLKKALKGLSDISREIHLGGRGMAHLEEVVADFCR